MSAIGVWSAPDAGRMAVSFRFLLSLYVVIPLCLLLAAADRWLLAGQLRASLPSSPSHFLLFQLLFGTPHIIASNLLLAGHADYLCEFKHKLLGMSLCIALFFGVGSLFIPYRVLYVLTACWTVYHVLKQQHGVAKAVCGLPPLAFYLQLWLSVAAGILIYLGVFLKNSLSPEHADLVFWSSGLLSGLLLLSTLWAQRFPRTGFGKWFLWANSFLVAASWLVYAGQYYFLAILMPRLVHDITAYTFYVSHDVNRQAEGPDGWLHRAAAACGLPPAWVLPAVSVLLTFVLQQYGDAAVNWLTEYWFSVPVYKAVSVGLIGYLALMHYYSEAFVWAKGSPLRRYIHFAR